jgi:excinuclease ABC subunit A
MIISSINEDARVEEIRGLSPTVSIHQKTVSSNPRSTVGTITEIYDFYRLLYTTIGHGYCPRHPSRALESTSVSTIIDALLARPNEEKFHILAPLNNPNHGSLEELSKYILES